MSFKVKKEKSDKLKRAEKIKELETKPNKNIDDLFEYLKTRLDKLEGEK